METALEMEHKIVLDSRNTLAVSGVLEVLAFDEETVRMDTVAGKLTVKGENLSITGFHKESGDLSATGRFHTAVYVADPQSSSFLSRFFR